MGTKNQDAALDVIGQKLRQKEEIDKPFDEDELKDIDLGIEESTEEELPKTVAYKLKSTDAGFNCLCELNLGKAYKYSCNKDEEGNIISEKRCKYPNSYKLAMNEKWLDYTLEQIKNATNPVVVISDIFSRVTTGNCDETLPYKEQLAYIYKKLNDENIKNKIVALVRGEKELEILRYSGIDLMDKLAKMLNMKNKLVDAGFHLTIDINKSKKHISFLHFNKKINSVRTLAISMQKYASENPGHDIYFCTNSKTNWYSCGVTTYMDNDGNLHQKPCWYIAFGGMYEYDKFNEKRPEIGPYTLNKNWFKIILDENEAVRADRIDYVYPHSSKIDASSYTASVISDKMSNSFKEMLNQLTPELDKMLEKLTQRSRKQIINVMHDTKQTSKSTKRTSKNIEQISQEKGE